MQKYKKNDEVHYISRQNKTQELFYCPTGFGPLVFRNRKKVVLIAINLH